MDVKISWYCWLEKMIKDFAAESAIKSAYEVVDIYECRKGGKMKAVIKLSDRHVIEKNICELVVDNELLEGFDKKTIRTLTYIATVESMKPEYSIVAQQIVSEIDEYLLEIKSKKSHAILKIKASEISRDESLLSKMDPKDANRIGYLAGVRETVKEYQLINCKKFIW